MFVRNKGESLPVTSPHPPPRFFAYPMQVCRVFFSASQLACLPALLACMLPQSLPVASFLLRSHVQCSLTPVPACLPRQGLLPPTRLLSFSSSTNLIHKLSPFPPALTAAVQSDSGSSFAQAPGAVASASALSPGGGMRRGGGEGGKLWVGRLAQALPCLLRPLFHDRRQWGAVDRVRRQSVHPGRKEMLRFSRLLASVPL